MRLSVQPADGLADEPLRITLAGVPPASEVTVAASAADADGARWGSEARFEAGGDGSVDLERHAPKAGTYDRTDPMGLLWSMRPPHEEDAPRFAIPWDRFEVAVEARADAQHARATVIRRFAAGGVERVDVVDEAMRATLFLPPGPGPHPAISLYHGSGGGIPGLAPSAALLASHGFAALVVGYFGVEGTPPTLCEVALESLAAGVRYLGAHPRVDPSRIGALGTSVGAEGVLAMASFIDDLDLRAVIGVSPSSVVWQALAEGRPPNRPRWTLGGAALPTRGSTASGCSARC